MLINYETHVSRYMCGGRGMKRFVGGSLSVVATKRGGNTRIFCGKCMESCRVEDGREIPWVIGRDLTNFLSRQSGRRQFQRPSTYLFLAHIRPYTHLASGSRMEEVENIFRFEKKWSCHTTKEIAGNWCGS